MTDNDDNDQWPDEMLNELPSAEKSDSGIFPGLDENNDLIPDSDQNFNGIPDWTEPILFYDADPPDFIYGIDFNNNGVVDYRENDALPDYPYPRDRRGLTWWATKKGLGRWGKWASVGYYTMQEPAGGGEAKAIYARYEHNFTSPYFGQNSHQRGHQASQGQYSRRRVRLGRRGFCPAATQPLPALERSDD